MQFIELDERKAASIAYCCNPLIKLINFLINFLFSGTFCNTTLFKARSAHLLFYLLRTDFLLLITSCKFTIHRR
jgi:hypothetical protein